MLPNDMKQSIVKVGKPTWIPVILKHLNWNPLNMFFISMALGEFRRRCRVTRWCSISDSDSELVELELEDDDELEEELELDMSKYL